MPQVTVLINGHEYDVACGAGQEQRTAELAAYVDGKVKDLVASLGSIGDQRLLLLASLIIVDELWDQQNAGATNSAAARRSARLEKLTERLDSLADRLEAAGGA